MYNVLKGQNGKSYVDRNSVPAVFHATTGNSKTGKNVGNYNLSIEYTCNHKCECYSKGNCYACHGCYQFANNQKQYSENYNYYMQNDTDTIANKITEFIQQNKLSLFRYFTCGDIPGQKFMHVMVKVAKNNPGVSFWTYTKKYNVVNSYCDVFGRDSIPNNLVIIFSHWLNDNGTYFPMNNKYNFPQSEFIPYGMESKAETVTHICPCSDPTKKVTCATCDHACYTLKANESMALLEHSTQRTKERDKTIKAEKAKL